MAFTRYISRDVYVDDIDMGWVAMSEEILKSKSEYVTVGIHEEDKGRVAINSPKEASISNVDAGVMSEFGATIQTRDGGTIEIPERPFIALTLVVYGRKYLGFMAALGARVLDEDRYTNEMALAELGAMVQEDMKQNILNDVFDEALKPSTLKKRRSKGVSDTRPLFDSRQLYDAIDYQVVA